MNNLYKVALPITDVEKEVVVELYWCDVPATNVNTWPYDFIVLYKGEKLTPEVLGECL